MITMRAILLLCVIALPSGLAEPLMYNKFLEGANSIDLASNTVVLPLHAAQLPSGTKCYFIVTEASTRQAAKAWKANFAPLLSSLKGTPQVQQGHGPAIPGGVLQVPATVDFTRGKRSLTPNPTTGFPPTAFNYSAAGDKGYSPLVQLPDGTILNAPHVAVQGPDGSLSTHPKVLSVAPDKSSVVFALTPGFSQGQRIVYISTEASDPLAATLENVPYVPLLAGTAKSALIDLVAFTNGQAGAQNPQRQGLASAIKDGMSPLNIAANTPASVEAYSPLWAVNLAKWVGPPGDVQTSVEDVQALAAEGKVASFDPKAPATNPPLGPSGIVVNCPIIATVVSMTVTNATPKATSQATRKGTSCTPSNLGYTCVVEAASGVRIHHSVGGQNPPKNVCTNNTVVAVGPGSMAHFLVEADNPGYVALSFPETAGKMWPADAVIGVQGASTAAPDVKTYHISQYMVSSADETSGWASGVGLVKAGGNGKQLMCFSRLLTAPSAAVVRTINPDAALPLNWALGSSNELVHHARRGSISISLAGGAARVDVGDRADTAFRIGHGALMLAAFVLLMPAAVLMARHKWIFGSIKESGKIKAGWFKLHTVVNTSAALLAVAGLIIILVRFGWTGRSDTTTYYTGHRAVGLATVGAVCVQVLLGVMRPHLGTQHRALWRRMHQAWGWLLLLMGTTASYMGMALIHDLSDIPLAYWLGPAMTITVALLISGAVLEAFKWKLESSGRYDKSSHTLQKSQTKGATMA